MGKGKDREGLERNRGMGEGGRETRKRKRRERVQEGGGRGLKWEGPDARIEEEEKRISGRFGKRRK